MKTFLIVALLSLASLADAQTSGLPALTDILSPDRATGSLAYQKNEYTSVTNGATQNLLNYTGSDGYVQNLFIAISGGTGGTLTDTVKIYYNGSGTATTSVPLQNLCMSVYMPYGTASSSYFSNRAVSWNATNSATGVSCDFKLPIPFSGGIKIDLINNSGATVTLWSMAQYQTGVPNVWPLTRVLHVDYDNITGVAANTVTTLANYTGGARGRFVGLYMMDDGFPGSVTPVGAELEGNIKLFLDGGSTEKLQSSGIEDWFGMGFYFGATGALQPSGTAASNTTTISAGYTGDGERGLTYVSNGAHVTQGAYRLHLQDKITFSSGVKITVACGDTTELSFTGTCAQYWTAYYYTEN